MGWNNQLDKVRPWMEGVQNNVPGLGYPKWDDLPSGGVDPKYYQPFLYRVVKGPGVSKGRGFPNIPLMFPKVNPKVPKRNP